MHTLYSYSGSDVAEFQRTYTNIVKHEFYDGDMEIDPSDKFVISVQKAMAHPISLLRLVTRFGISFRRSWHHIRTNKVGVRVLWFVRHGELRIVRSRGTCTVRAGECAILDSNAPFHARVSAEEGGTFDAVQAIVPAHLFLSHLPMAAEFNSSFEIGSGDRQAIAKLLDLLFGEGDHLSRNVAEPLVAAFLETISDNISDLAEAPTRRQRVVDRRLADIETYIMKNLTDPDLSYDEVAANCGISPRYLCYVLKANNTSFSHLLWSQRLPKARDWLVSEALQSYPIHEIAFMAGFKSAAHFSRMFKSVYGCSPKEYRASGGHAADETGSVPTMRAADKGARVLEVAA